LEQENLLGETVTKAKKRRDKLSRAIEKMRRAGLKVEVQTEGGIGFIGGIPPYKK
jgi:hypothetical protein